MIVFDNVSYSYLQYTNEGKKQVEVLNGVSFTLSDKEFVSLVGKNGAGKSTIARLAQALYTPTQGDVIVDGINTKTKDVNELTKIRSLVGVVGQNPYDQLVASTVFDEVAFGPSNLKLDENEIYKRVENSLKTVGMGAYVDRDPSTLSGGESQKLALASILAMNPLYIIFDETGAMLDPKSRAELNCITQELLSEGLGILKISHFASDVIGADKVVVLDDKKVIFNAAAEEFLSNNEVLYASGVTKDVLMQTVSQLLQNKELDSTFRYKLLKSLTEHAL